MEPLEQLREVNKKLNEIINSYYIYTKNYEITDLAFKGQADECVKILDELQNEIYTCIKQNEMMYIDR